MSSFGQFPAWRASRYLAAVPHPLKFEANRRYRGCCARGIKTEPSVQWGQYPNHYITEARVDILFPISAAKLSVITDLRNAGVG